MLNLKKSLTEDVKKSSVLKKQQKLSNKYVPEEKPRKNHFLFDKTWLQRKNHLW